MISISRQDRDPQLLTGSSIWQTVSPTVLWRPCMSSVQWLIVQGPSDVRYPYLFKIRNDSGETWELLTIKLPPFGPYFPCIRGRHNEQVTKQWQLLRTWRKGVYKRLTVTTDTDTEKECDNKDPDLGGKHWRDGPKMKRRFRWAGIQNRTLSWCEALPTPVSSAFERL